MPTVNNIKLNDITLEYNSFVDSQVLTAKQLNDIVEFFEDQQRLTRTTLIGVGLVCGLNITSDTTGITVSKGCGVTTDGDLLYMPQTTYANFRPYDNSLIKYPPFYPLGTDQAQMALWELVLPDATTNQLPVDSIALTGFKDKASSDITSMIGLLYLEYYQKEPDACTAIDCDNQGKKQVAVPKVLLVSQANMEQIINRTNTEVIADDIFKNYYTAYQNYYNLVTLGARRVFLNSAATASPTGLASAYVSAVNAGASSLVNAINKLYDTFKFVIDPTSKYNIAGILSSLNAALTKTPSTYQAQYFYDFYKDLVTTYNELRALLADIVYICCPDIYSFPKHLMLGYVNGNSARPAPYRHRFYQSPAVTQNKEKLHNAESLAERFLLLIKNFGISANSTTVKITPSVNNNQPLGARAMPFYYNDPASLAEKWSYGRWLQGTQKQVLGYNSSVYAASNDMVINPLNYSIDANDFFRIEGHIGKKYTDALQEVITIKQNFNLPFDVVAIRQGALTLDDIDLDDYACQFNDLEAILNAFKAEQNCLYAEVSQFFSNFNTTTGYQYLALSDVAYRKMDLRVAKAITMTETGSTAGASAAEKAAGTQSAETEVTRAKAAPTPAYTQLGATDAGIYKASDSNYKILSGTDVIDGNIITEKDTIGYYFSNISKDTGALTIADYADAAARVIDTSKLGNAEKTIAIDIPVRIIAGTRNISQWLPDRLVDIDQDTLDNFTAKLADLCAQVKTALKNSRAVFNKSGYVKKGYEQDYELTLWQMSENCCAGEALEVILKQILQRKQDLLKQLTFSAYAANHPGLEHKAGVPAGGTFVMVYATTNVVANPTTTNQTKDEIAKAKEARLKALENSQDFVAGFEKDEDAVKYIGDNITVDDAKDAIARYQQVSGRKYTPTKQNTILQEIEAVAKQRAASAAQAAATAVPTSVVFADFCLPYLCCSDCPPVAFIMPQPKVALSLPKAVACSDEPLMLFKASPSDGVVKAPSGFEKTVVVKDGSSYFDPSQVTDGSFGKAIQFALNDQTTDCIISIIKHPVITPTAKAGKNTDIAIVIALDATTNQITGDVFTYSWKLADGTVAPSQTTPKLEHLYSYDDIRKMNVEGNLQFTLTATNQNCSNTQTCSVKIDLPKQQPILVLAQTEVCSDAGTINFTTVKPDGGIVASKTAGAAVKLVGTQWVFDPSKGPYETTISDFTVNGDAVANCSIVIHEHPKPSFKPEQVDVSKLPKAGNKEVIIGAAAGRVVAMHFNNTTPDVDSFSYTWAFGTENKSTDASPTIGFNMTDYPHGRNIEVILTATNKKDTACKAMVRTTVALPGLPTRPIITHIPTTGSTDLNLNKE
ncbi:hypothetical protein FO440_02140 [Mucilaginibacter corticis]|uniref:PKD domain-containing protein n=1 Tax=Mucilaginibacter corticis TaxID=2597670 RepID=A0A556MSW3_9SPHI|nr:hypothetical protein [Mucilaginibacter corticis]TSJ43013.1 hypothetical protein FO440_02140 [Mucilaginibacter corticis]